MSYHFGASNEHGIGSGRHVRTSTCRYRRPLRTSRWACGKGGALLVVPGKRRWASRAAACGNAAVARARIRSNPVSGQLSSYRTLFQPSVAMAKKKAAAAKPAAKK